MPLSIFPANGLDRSLHAPILVGLIFVTFFTEAFGWTYAGLVVPGYLAVVFAAAPFTGVLTTFEALVTYGMVALIGIYIPKTSAWSTAFGRERFFLFIVCGIIVRYLTEGYICPQLTDRYAFTHARELYSVGLVIIPLFANVFWTAGVKNAGPRLFVIAGLTYLVVRFGLLPYTNYSLSRFLIANESGELDFIASSKSEILLLVGALLGARNNVMYGWDYNGILVPALLAVSWYEPKKLISTVVEGIVVYALCIAITSIPPFSRMLIVGTRRMLVAAFVGFAVKLVAGFFLMRYYPGVQIVDYLGFGYILPSLLAVKMWNKGHIGIVVMPTVQVSLSAFIAGNLVGYGLSWFHQDATRNLETITPPAAQHPPSFTLALGDVAPEPPVFWSRSLVGQRIDQVSTLSKQFRNSSVVTRALLDTASQNGVHVGLWGTPLGGWVLITPDSKDPEVLDPAPRVAVRLQPKGASPWMIAISAPSPGSPLFDVAFALAEKMDSRAVVVLSRHTSVGETDKEIIERLTHSLSIENILLLESQLDPAHSQQADDKPPSLSIAGLWPVGLNSAEIEHVLHSGVEISWRARAQSGQKLLAEAAQLRYTESGWEQVASTLLPDVPVQSWQGPLRVELPARVIELTTVSALGPKPFSIDELRLFRSALGPSVIDLSMGVSPSPWQRILAGRLGLRFASIGSGSLQVGPVPPEGYDASGYVEETAAWALFEPAQEHRRGLPSIYLRPNQSAGLLIEVPAPRWELGTVAAGEAFFDAMGASGLLVAGGLPGVDPTGSVDPRRPEGRRALFQLLHEVWLEHGGTSVSLQGIAPERTPPEDAVLSLGREISVDDIEPAWTSPIRESLEKVGFRVGRFDGARAHAAFGASADPTMAFAEKFAPDKHAVLWMTPALRELFSLRGDPDRPGTDIHRLPMFLPHVDVAQRAFELVRCVRGESTPDSQGPCPSVGPKTAYCDLDAETVQWQLFTREHNPYDLRTGLKTTRQCVREVYIDSETRMPWVLLANGSLSYMIPLGGVPIERRSEELRDLAAIRRAVRMRLSMVKAAPP